MKNQLIVSFLSKQFQHAAQTLDILNGISYIFEQGKTYAVIGSSGAGKSTLLHILAGLEAPTQGTVLFNEKSIATFTERERLQFLNKSVGLVFQLPYLIDELSVIENVMVKGLIAGFSYDYCRQKALSLLKTVGLAIKEDSRPSLLSGGQQQRVAIVRALFNEPFFLLADEPTGNLDEKTGKDIVAFLLECHTQWGMGIIVSSHDSYVAQALHTRLHLHNGCMSVEK